MPIRRQTQARTLSYGPRWAVTLITLHPEDTKARSGQCGDIWLTAASGRLVSDCRRLLIAECSAIALSENTEHHFDAHLVPPDSQLP